MYTSQLRRRVSSYPTGTLLAMFHDYAEYEMSGTLKVDSEIRAISEIFLEDNVLSHSVVALEVFRELAVRGTPDLQLYNDIMSMGV